MVNKFEMIGIFGSIALMALALFLLRVESSSVANLDVTGESQPAVAVVAESEEDALFNALVDAVDTDGELQKMIIDDVLIGSGPAVEEGDTVTVHYIGRLQTGQEFDNSYNRGEPFTFTVGQGRVIEGWEEGLKGMQVNGQRVLVIPPHMGYGVTQVGPIPANSTLLFTIELISIE
jgi:FKBP-type peptidyl-prolyl cis-trans isomerase